VPPIPKEKYLRKTKHTEQNPAQQGHFICRVAGKIAAGEYPDKHGAKDKLPNHGRSNAPSDPSAPGLEKSNDPAAPAGLRFGGVCGLLAHELIMRLRLRKFLVGPNALDYRVDKPGNGRNDGVEQAHG